MAADFFNCKLKVAIFQEILPGGAGNRIPEAQEILPSLVGRINIIRVKTERIGVIGSSDDPATGISYYSFIKWIIRPGYQKGRIPDRGKIK